MNKRPCRWIKGVTKIAISPDAVEGVACTRFNSTLLISVLSEEQGVKQVVGETGPS